MIFTCLPGKPAQDTRNKWLLINSVLCGGDGGMSGGSEREIEDTDEREWWRGGVIEWESEDV